MAFLLREAIPLTFELQRESAWIWDRTETEYRSANLGIDCYLFSALLGAPSILADRGRFGFLGHRFGRRSW